MGAALSSGGGGSAAAAAEIAKSPVAYRLPLGEPLPSNPRARSGTKPGADLPAKTLTFRAGLAPLLPAYLPVPLTVPLPLPVTSPSPSPSLSGVSRRGAGPVRRRDAAWSD